MPFDISSAKPVGQGFDLHTAKPVEPTAKEVGLIDRARAGAAGVNRGFIDLAGLPVDTIQNMIDLGKAAYGTAVTAAGHPDMAPAIADRSNIVGTSEWFAKQARDFGAGSAVDNPNPQDTASRVLHTSGRFAGASMVPSPKVPVSAAQQARNALMGGLSGLAAGATAEVAPDYAGLAGMLPGAAAGAASAGVRRAVRGGEAGRADMQNRLLTLKGAGVENPSVGLASGNKLFQLTENVLSYTPGSIKVMGDNRLATLAGLEGKMAQARDGISPVYGPVEAGAAIQSDLKGPFRDRISATYDKINSRVEGMVGPNRLMQVPQSIATTEGLTTPIPGAENTSSLLIQPRVRNIGQALKADAGGTPAQAVPIAGLLDSGGNPLTRMAAGTPPQGLPFSALKELRSKVGKEASSNAIIGTPEQAEFKRIYGAMSEDMKSGIASADMSNKLLPGAPGSASALFQRGNNYYGNAMDRVENLNNLANRSTPEGAYGAVEQSLKSGPTTYERVRNAVQPETRQKVAATVIDELGRAAPGQQNAEGNAWSPQSFVTNYNKLDPKARAALFKRIPGGEKYAEDLSTIAKAADMVNQSAKMGANPSGTAAALSTRAAASALTIGTFVAPLAAAGTAAGLAGGHVAARLLTNKEFVHWLADTQKVKPEQMAIHMQRLMESAKASKNAQYQEDVSAYLDSVKRGAK